MGGPVDTGGRAAVALRCDHGLAPFRDKVLPLARAARWRISQAYNPRNWHYAENHGVTPADLNTWVASGDVEVWNHSATHGPASRKVELLDEIFGGLREIEDQLPAARGQVWGWNPPGLAPGNYGGFDGGRTAASWATPAGRLILRHHAVASGMLHGTHLQVLDGTVRIGLARWQIDSRPVPETLRMIDRAVLERRGLQLMLHPAELDRPGRLTEEGLRRVVRHILRRRRQGLLITVSPYQLTLADATRGPRASRVARLRRRRIRRRLSEG
ncbi:hypothetical protein [Brachybacterium sp. YJGR34]|uniref:hypothetical protein n=1 Tax=Brachybacterium sp. YJGR34 TaxID=2059911 RepID=UPI000E0B4634|nr:hypothetical protein [Brachybacterium sp. YJGR34]